MYSCLDQDESDDSNGDQSDQSDMGEDDGEYADSSSFSDRENDSDSTYLHLV